MTGLEVKGILQLSGDVQLIQGILMCIRCNPEGILKFVKSRSTADGKEIAGQAKEKGALPINKPSEIK